MQLAILHPQVAGRSCEDCQTWRYDEDTGRPEVQLGEPQRRLNPNLTPCRTQKGCPKGTPEESRALTAQNALAWQFCRECRAVGKWPDDPIVQRNAAVVEYAERLAQDALDNRRHNLLSEIVLRALAAR